MPLQSCLQIKCPHIADQVAAYTGFGGWAAKRFDEGRHRAAAQPKALVNQSVGDFTAEEQGHHGRGGRVGCDDATVGFFSPGENPQVDPHSISESATIPPPQIERRPSAPPMRRNSHLGAARLASMATWLTTPGTSTTAPLMHAA